MTYEEMFQELISHNWWDVPLRFGISFMITLAIIGLILYFKPTLLTGSAKEEKQ